MEEVKEMKISTRRGSNHSPRFEYTASGAKPVLEELERFVVLGVTVSYLDRATRVILKINLILSRIYRVTENRMLVIARQYLCPFQSARA